MVRLLLLFGADSAKKDSSGRDCPEAMRDVEWKEVGALRTRPYSLRLCQDQASQR